MIHILGFVKNVYVTFGIEKACLEREVKKKASEKTGNKNMQYFRHCRTNSSCVYFAICLGVTANID